MQKDLSQRTNSLLILALPILWGVLTFLCLKMFDVHRFSIAKTGDIWWLVRMAALIPLWIQLSKWNLLDDNMHTIRFGKISIPLGNWKFWLSIAYAMAVFASFGPHLGFVTRATFGAIVSPIFEEYLIRAPLRRWFKAGYLKLLIATTLSSALFALMHWFYLPDFGASMSFEEHQTKFLAHFIFGFVLAVIYFATKRIQIPLILHIISNLRWVPS